MATQIDFIAPCGHPGEPVIGTYVRCTSGCDALVRTTSSPPRLGLPERSGHVLGCDCRECRLRRRARTVVLRTRQGKDLVTVPIDRAKLSGDRITLSAPTSGTVRHIVLQDEDGHALTQQSIDVAVTGGLPMEIHLDRLLRHALGALVVSEETEFLDQVSARWGVLRKPGESDANLRIRMRAHLYTRH